MKIFDSGLKPDMQNANEGTQRGLGLLDKSLRKLGAGRSILVDANGNVIAGNKTLERAADIDLPVRIIETDGKELIAVKRTDLDLYSETDKRARQLAYADNKVAELDLAWKPEQIALDFEPLDLGEWGFEAEPEQKDAEPQIDRAAELNEKWKVVTGDLWQIGEHRLLCGDSTKREDVDRVMGGEKYCLLADPPYNIGFNYASIEDNKNEQEWIEFCNSWFSVCTNSSIASIITPGPRNAKYYPDPKDSGVWVKRNATAGASVFHLRICEPILFYGKFDNKRNTDLFEYTTGFTEELASARSKAGVSDGFPPVKSLPLWIELVGMLGGTILDPFGGNGTTLIACQNSHKKGRSIELYPAFCSVILERMNTAFPDLKIERLRNTER